MTNYTQLLTLLNQYPNAHITFHLPDKTLIPAHYHITEIGAIRQDFIDCGGEVRADSHLQIQLWLGKDTEHRITASTLLNILSHSESITSKLTNLSQQAIYIEYKAEQATIKYSITDMQVQNEQDEIINIYTAYLPTQCLAALRHEKEKQVNNSTNSCCNTSSCGTSCC